MPEITAVCCGVHLRSAIGVAVRRPPDIGHEVVRLPSGAPVCCPSVVPVETATVGVATTACPTGGCEGACRAGPRCIWPGEVLECPAVAAVKAASNPAALIVSKSFSNERV